MKFEDDTSLWLRKQAGKAGGFTGTILKTIMKSIKLLPCTLR